MSDHLTEAAQHLDAALEHHEAGRHISVKRRIELARACVQRAIEGTGHDASANPTAAAGAQTSDGQSSGESGRAYDPEVRRQQDQRRSCQIAYDERLRQMGVRR